MAAYTAYQLTMLAISILYACEEEELELSQMKDRQACTKLYTENHKDAFGAINYDETHYCCYDSALPRIINEGAQSQLGRDQLGCYGFSVPELKQIDWDQVDFGEWEAIMIDSGLLPKYGVYSVESVSERIPGLGYVEDDDLENTLERTVNRLEDSCPDSIRQGIDSNLSGRVNYTIDYESTGGPIQSDQILGSSGP